LVVEIAFLCWQFAVGSLGVIGPKIIGPILFLCASGKRCWLGVAGYLAL
jgi:hypothetical protein